MTLPRRFVVMLSLLNIAAAASMLAVTPLAAARDADAATGAPRRKGRPAPTSTTTTPTTPTTSTTSATSTSANG